ncbi:MAG: hypothetical protein A2381_00700 [Bdellovibrionales bacterium RIFOXYB1_FULL_37_110]|nr:MAG: hypothetical protein A2417_01555 [Bdellovibrionales bacterium RIFOXYC1_FULL_37_79]OFZ58738.1 MAG: hypothetical protein A2381_00700 [Bdellovibrionales bacterium RIFOXYB1_FULL_37_110]OFZ64737.1 MAG: hypothetical protein A2577_06700 [Bdellovibrionales bacterium RIFOXYD1_FULL_36_51]
MDHQYTRSLSLGKHLNKSSLFLFGARNTGKSFLIQHTFPKLRYIDLLDSDCYSALLRRPKALEEMLTIKDKCVIIDEIQKLPALLDVIHRLIETRKINFLLTGSSSRKIKREGGNLLGGRAREFHLYPLTSKELGLDFDLIKYLNRGGLPRIYKSDDPYIDLKAYVNLYLAEEIKQEALIRKFEQFVRFLDTMSLSNGEELHLANIANDSGISPRTLEGYIQVLEDTLVGFQVYPFFKTKKRKAITKSKFYFFDIGVTNFLANRGEIKNKSELFGRALEQFIALEIRAYLSYNNKREQLYYWRTKNGFEVDFIIGTKAAIEVKASSRISDSELKNLKALREEKLIEKYFVISQEPFRRTVDGITILPIGEFLKELWSDRLFTV